MFNEPVTLSSVVVLDPDGEELLQIEGDALAATTQTLFDKTRYAHVQPGSLTVDVGDEVEAGTPLAELGNTGPSLGPHLHFGLLDTTNPATGRSLPFVLDSYTLVGTVDFATSEGDHLVITPDSKEVRSEYPLYGGIQNFP